MQLTRDTLQSDLNTTTTPASQGAPQPRGSAQAEDVRRQLGLDGRGKWKKRVIWLVVLAGLGVGAYFVYDSMNQPVPPPTWQTQAVERGELRTTISATGTLKPTRIVTVGAEVGGRILSVEARENDRVTKGQVLVRLDPETLNAQLEQAQASEDAATANVAEARASLAQAQRDEKRAKELAAKGISSAQTLEQAKSARSLASARVTAALAQEKLAKAKVQGVETDLAKAVIVAPIDGIVLTRYVEPGQAVVSSLQTPTLFEIAEDLTHMELQLDIDEADVGVVQAGQKATFTVDAYADKQFEATVEKVYFASTTTNNVVTYPAILTVDNSDLLLRPGMTSAATITTGVAENALIVPNAALRFSPRAALGDAAGGGGSRRGGFGMFGGPRGPRPSGAGG
ncbi:MAG: efflux RND transporter periplasmic adaptor subunit, partial [Myxococcales bacterium]|nr:efflux RND transporter periplasmic adaptor subunit [Myxococcales bacterium]